MKERYKAVASELRAAVAAGETTEEEANARWEAFEGHATADAREAEAEAAARRILAADRILAGKGERYSDCLG